MLFEQEENSSQLESQFVHLMSQTGAKMEQTAEMLDSSVGYMEKQVALYQQMEQESFAQSDEKGEKLAEINQQIADSNEKMEKRLAEDSDNWEKCNANWEEQITDQNASWNKRWGKLTSKMKTIANRL